MSRIPSLAAMTLTAAMLAGPVLTPWAEAQSDTAGANQPVIGTGTPAKAPGDTKASTPSPAGTLGVASVKLENGWRASKLIGSTVYNEQNQKIGTVDDLIMTNADRVVVAVISVGGFLGIGAKLIAVPYAQLRMDNGKALLPGASKDALAGLPSFTYGNT